MVFTRFLASHGEWLVDGATQPLDSGWLSLAQGADPSACQDRARSHRDGCYAGTWRVYLFRWKLPCALSVMELSYHLRHHRRDACIRVVGVGRSGSATDVAVESLEVTGCP